MNFDAPSNSISFLCSQTSIEVGISSDAINDDGQTVLFDQGVVCYFLVQFPSTAMDYKIILPASQIICKEVTMARENSGISTKRHQIRVPQLETSLYVYNIEFGRTPLNFQK